jgi:outer membrane protein assembly factor BamB
MLPLSTDDPRVLGEFRLHARLGAGGMGRVYLASSPGGRAVAVKVVHRHLASDAAFVDRFRREVAAAQAVNGGYTAPVIAAGPDDDPPWLATAFVAGPTLAEVVTGAGPLPQDAVLKLTAGLAEALRAIHDAGLVHRDLKPGNVLLADDGPRVIDFGIARALDGTSLTSAESVLGTPSFMSPEQAQGQPAGPASDVFSLGGVVYFAATGTTPFGAGHPAVLLYRIVHTEPDLAPLPPRLRDLIAACLAQDPARRATTAELSEALLDVVPPGDSPATFWPAPVAQLIRGHQAGLAPGAPDGGFSAPATIRVGPGPDPGPGPRPGLRPDPGPGSRPGPGPGSRPDPGLGLGLGPGPRPGPGSTVATGPRTVVLERRRVLAALAGVAAGGLAVAWWETAGPGSGRGTASGRLVGARHPVARPGTGIWRAGISSPVRFLAVAGGIVYAGSERNTVYALDAVTGKQVWWRATPTTFNGQLVVAGGALVIADPDDGGVAGLDAATGRQLWSVPSGRTGAGGVLGLVADGGRVFCGYAAKSGTTGGVTAFSAAAGTLLWTTEFEQDLDINGGLAAESGTVYAATGYGEVYAYQAADGTRLWRDHGRGLKFGGNASPLAAGGVCYLCDDNKPPVLYALRASGERLWRAPLGAADDATWLAVSADVLFIGDTGGRGAGYLAARNAATGEQLWRAPVSGGVFPVATAGPVVYSGSNNGVLDAWQASTGNHLWSYRGAGTRAIVSNLVVAGGVAYFAADDRSVHAVAA